MRTRYFVWKIRKNILKKKIESGSNTEKNYKAELGQIEKQLSESSDDIAELLQNVRNLEKESNDLQSKAEKLNEEFNRISEKKTRSHKA